MILDTESDKEEELPPQLRLVQDARKRFGILALDADRQVKERIGRPHEVGGIVYVESAKVDLPLTSIGCDEVGFVSIEHSSFDGGKPSHVDAPEVHVITMDLFADGSPFVSDGDTIGEGRGWNRYQLVLAPELPPCLAQEEQTIELDQEAWSSARKHILSEEDCELILSHLPELKVDVDEEVRLAELGR